VDPAVKTTGLPEEALRVPSAGFESVHAYVVPAGQVPPVHVGVAVKGDVEPPVFIDAVEGDIATEARGGGGVSTTVIWTGLPFATLLPCVALRYSVTFPAEAPAVNLTVVPDVALSVPVTALVRAQV
jgi:hypothetical protein